uniref:Uncharacterized protein n=1 Tax=uncultured marine virus TaxID=186617 RepID=A0A0F7LAP6_9VIRU|nr:hypothetical protein [uncultured marine virus]
MRLYDHVPMIQEILQGVLLFFVYKVLYSIDYVFDRILQKFFYYVMLHVF